MRFIITKWGKDVEKRETDTDMRNRWREVEKSGGKKTNNISDRYRRRLGERRKVQEISN